MGNEIPASSPVFREGLPPSAELAEKIRRSVGGVLGLRDAFGADDGLLPWWLPLVPGARLRFNLGMKSCVDRAAALAIAGKYDAQAWSRSSRTSAHVAEACGGKIEISGLENLAASQGPAVVAGNHMSALETFLLPHLIMSVKGKAAFVVKRELLEEGSFAPVMRAVPYIALNRSKLLGKGDKEGAGDDMKTMLAQWPKLHEEGHSVCIFPGGTRTEFFNPTDSGEAPFSPVAALISRKLKAPLVPFAVQTSMWSNRRSGRLRTFEVTPGNVRVAFGESIPANVSVSEKHGRCVDFITKTLRGWGVEVRDGKAGA